MELTKPQQIFSLLDIKCKYSGMDIRCAGWRGLAKCREIPCGYQAAFDEIGHKERVACQIDILFVYCYNSARQWLTYVLFRTNVE